MNKEQRNKHDIAYICFLPPGILNFISAIASVIPMGTGTAGGIGFLILIPFALIALISVPIGIYLSIEFRKDILLPILSVLTILIFAEIMLESAPVLLRKVVFAAYGITVIIFEIIWFFYKRRRFYLNS